MVNIHPEQNRIYRLRHQDSNLTEKELLAKEKRVSTFKNKLKLFIGIGGEVITIKEEQQLKKLHAKQAANAQQTTSATNQTSTATNKTDQSIWTMKK